MIFETLGAAFTALIIGGIAVLVSSSRPVNGVDDRPRATAKDNLLYIAMFITLSVSISNFISIVFAAIDKAIPDTLKNGQNYNPYNDDMRFAIASLVVMFPLYLYFAFYTSKDITVDPKKAGLAIRKNIFYLIGIITAITIIGTLIYSIYSWLGGELTSRFMSKAFVTLLVAAGTFVYTKYSLKRDFAVNSKTPMMMSVAAGVLVLIGIVFSVNVLGTPGSIRKMKYDDQRLQDLSNIQQQVLSAWQRDKKLPTDLTILQDQFSGYAIPKDPRDSTSYTYKIIEDTKYVKATGVDCARYQKPVYNTNGYQMPISPDSSATCELPTSAVFEICAQFETERIYSTGKGNNYVPSPVAAAADAIMGVPRSNSVYLGKYDTPMYSVENYYYGNDDSNPFWDHKAEKTCFKRTIDAKKYNY